MAIAIVNNSARGSISRYRRLKQIVPELNATQQRDSRIAHRQAQQPSARRDNGAFCEQLANQPPAPTASRTAISLARAEARLLRRPATLKQAVNNSAIASIVIIAIP